MEYTAERLAIDLQVFTKRVAGYDPSFALFFETLLPFGFRFNELINVASWSIVDVSYLLIPTEKGGNDRIHPISDFSPLILDAVHDKRSIFAGLRIWSVSSYFRALYPSGIIYHETKVIKSHLYRHNICKQMFKQGITISEISAFLGEKVAANTVGYVESKLTSFF